MHLRPGNLVKYRVGDSPIMYVEHISGAVDRNCLCVWVEDGVRRKDSFPSGTLQTVYVDGTPRRYPKEY
jgi:hypothetical protein